jgi:dienelactone hydrolase
VVERVQVGKRRTAALISEPTTPPPWPAVILAHGMWRTAESVMPFARKLAAQGFLAVAVELRGNRPLADVLNQEKLRRSAKEFMNFVAHISMMSARDIADVCETLREEDAVTAGRIGLWGNSLGCHAVLAAVPLCKPAAAVGAYGNADWDLMWRLTWPHFHPDAPLPPPQWAPNVKQLVDDLEPVNHAAEFFPTALLLQHGEDDHPMVDGMTSLYDKVMPHYKRQPDRLKFELFQGGHQFPLAAEESAAAWLERWLT